MSTLARLQQAGALRAIDVEFARLLKRLDGRDDDVFALAAATASQAIAQGHSCLPLSAYVDVLAAAASEPLRVVLPVPALMRESLATSTLVSHASKPGSAPLVFDGGDRLWLRRYFDYEGVVAAGLRARARSLRPLEDIATVRARLMQRVPRTQEINWQAIAVALGLRSRLAIVSGGPGTGKTTSVLWMLIALLEAAQAQGAPLPRIRLAAPTGKAAARLGESIRERKAGIPCSDAVRAAIRENEASTIHRLLGYRPHAGFRHDRNNPVAADVVVVDEASMTDLPLMAHLLEGLAENTALILLGDVGQLASVETGHVLASIGASATEVNRYTPAVADDLAAMTGFAVPHAESPAVALADAFVELQDSHRFGADSGIGQLAHAIRAGDADAALAVLRANANDVVWRRGDRVQLAHSVREEWVAAYRGIGDADTAPAALALATRLRILTALRDGPFGNISINRAIEESIGGGAGWYQGRLVMVTANDYRRGLFNGDIGVAWRTPAGDIEVCFPAADGALRAFAPYTLPAHEPAFAMTVHKSQGSEFDAVAIVLPDAPNRVLGRELLYTAVTRARTRVVVHGEEGIVRAAIAHHLQRWSGLPDRLRDA
ncbi:MAG: exodeoxyribonuclease V subunit alpha [Dokdonella sp.]